MLFGSGSVQCASNPHEFGNPIETPSCPLLPILDTARPSGTRLRFADPRAWCGRFANVMNGLAGGDGGDPPPGANHIGSPTAATGSDGCQIISISSKMYRS